MPLKGCSGRLALSEKDGGLLSVFVVVVAVVAAEEQPVRIARAMVSATAVKVTKNGCIFMFPFLFIPVDIVSYILILDY